MKANLLNKEGKKIKEIETKNLFSFEIREDIVQKVLESKKRKQPYAPSLVAGNQQSASGKLIRRRHVWKSGYGRAASRVPRKQMSRSGTQFNWVAAAIPSVRGGRRAHPPKILSMLKEKKINKKEMKIAILSALNATANEKEISKRYSSLNEIKNLPLIVDDLNKLKTKEFIEILKKVFKEAFSVALKKKNIRAGKGTMRGRKYKTNTGALIVIGKDEELKISCIDVKKAKEVGINDLATGGLGRLTLYTEGAIKELEKRFEKLKEKKNES